MTRFLQFFSISENYNKSKNDKYDYDRWVFIVKNKIDKKLSLHSMFSVIFKKKLSAHSKYVIKGKCIASVGLWGKIQKVIAAIYLYSVLRVCNIEVFFASEKNSSKDLLN